MATKAQLEAENSRLEGENQSLIQKLQAARETIARLRSGEPKKPAVKSCINCGQVEQPVQRTKTGYKCPLCEHEWTDEHEKAPFRQRR